MPLKDRLVGSLFVALVVASGFSVWVTMLRIIRGTQFFTGLGVGYPYVILLYILSASVSGAIVALLLPIARTMVGAYVVGTIAVWPMYFGAIFLLYAEPGWMLPGAIVAAGISALTGGPAGVYIRHTEQGDR